MIKIKNFLKINVLAVLLIGFLTVAITGQNADFKPVADEMIGSSGISWVPKVNYAQLTLTISRPDGTVFSTTFDSGSSPYADLSNIFGNSYQDGSYTYELVVIPSVGQRVRGENTFSTSQTAAAQQYPRGLTQSGAFYVQNGGIVTGNMTEFQTSPGISSGQEGLSGTLDNVIADDLIVQFSACVGNDCVNGENFGFDTLRLKENNLRINFADTSNSASFPSNDWRIVINDTSNGGANYFAVEDSETGRQVFKILAEAPANSLYVDAQGDVGLGTSSPVVNAHVVDGNTPTMRLEQNGSSGFTPQTWDLAGNEANFFIRDVTHSSHLPFRIKPNAPEDSIFIDTDGVGFGTDNPSFPIHVVTGSSTNAEIVAERAGGATNFLSAGGSFGFIGTTSEHPVRINVFGNWRMQLNTDNSLAMASGATCTTGGVWTSVSSREAKENIKDLTTDEAIETLAGLNPVKFNYKVEKDEEYVGFIAEDVPELVATKDRKHLTPMDVVSVLTKVVQEQQEFIKEQQKLNVELKKKIADLEK